MKIVNSAAGGNAGQKVGVAGPTNPFKKVMSGATQPRPPQVAAKVTQLPAQGQKKLPGGVAPLTASAPKASVLQPAPKLKQVTAAASTRETARAHANAKAENLVELRSNGTEEKKQRYDTRVVDLICQELKAEFGNELARPQAANSDRQQPSPIAQQPVASVTSISQSAAKEEAAVKAASAVELIEKIETFVKSQRPGLALTLESSLGARVEIERLGPKEVALRVVGKNGPPAPEDIGRIREEMRARGLKVGALSVA